MIKELKVNNDDYDGETRFIIAREKESDRGLPVNDLILHYATVHRKLY
jgi:hypothetical protein